MVELVEKCHRIYSVIEKKGGNEHKKKEESNEHKKKEGKQ